MMPSHCRRMVTVVGLAAVLALGSVAACFCADAPVAPSDAQVSAQVRRILHIADRPAGLHLGGTGILWMTGAANRWGAADVAAILRWVGEGHVCWVDLGLAQSFGFNDSVAAAMQAALPAEGASGHPLLQGVKSIECADTFRYMIEFPKAGTPVLVAQNGPQHVVVGVWPVGKGVVIFRPQPNPGSVSWTEVVERRWIEPYRADGARFLANLNLYSLDVLRAAGFPLPAVPAD